MDVRDKRRMASFAVRGKHTPNFRVGKREDREHMTGKQRWHMVQLIACALVFVSLVGTKLNMPERFLEIRESVTTYLYNDSDYKSVFSIIGRTIGGEESVSKSIGDIYTAVFSPGTKAVETAVDATGRQGDESLSTSSDYVGSNSESAEPDSATNVMSISLTTKDGQEKAQQAAAVIYTDEDIPNDAYMQQKVLGIAYTTPVVGALSSPFGYREHPIEGEEKFHYGIDIAASAGSTIGAFADGTVTAAGESTTLGKYIKVTHKNNITTLYAHCSKLCVSSGASVKKGDKLAEVGETGLATGPHCHFQLEMDGVYLNPVYYVKLS